MLGLLSRRRDEQGVAMVSVVILILVCFTVASVVAASTIFGVRQTHDDQSRLQALAAAEGGRDYALSQLARGCTTPSLSNATAPVFAASVFPSTAKPTTPATLTAGCPTPGAKYVLISSTGTAADGTTQKTVLATYPVKQTFITSLSGAVVGPKLGGSSWSYINVAAGAAAGDVVLGSDTSSGAFQCDNTTHITGNVIVEHGSITLTDGCRVDGSIYARGSVTLNSTNRYDVTVGGDIWTTGKVVLGGNTGHSVVVGGKITSSTHTAASNVTVAGGYVTWTSAMMDAPQLSTKTWLDYPGVALGDFSWAPDGYVVKTAADLGGCDFTQPAAIAKLQALSGTSVIVDATACTHLNFQKSGGSALAISTNLIFLAPSYNAQDLTVTSAGSTGAHEFDLITPDSTSNDIPDCTGTAAASTISGVVMDSTIKGAAYTPCQLSLGITSTHTHAVWNGQVVAGVVSVTGNTNGQVINYTSMMPPGLAAVAAAGSYVLKVLPNLLGQTEP